MNGSSTDAKKDRDRTLPLLLIVLILAFTDCRSPRSGNTYYIDGIKGNDNNSGTLKHPLKSIGRLNLLLQKKSCNVMFAGGQVHEGTLTLTGVNGNDKMPLRISSYGNVRAVINGGNEEAVKIENCRYISVTDLDITGNGRKNGNTTNGLSVIRSGNITVENLKAEGFQKSGVDLYDCVDCEIKNVIATGNGFCGINIMGSQRNLSRHIIIKDCRAENNPGDPTNLDNHSGNGILAGVSDSVTIDHCTATNNGWDMPRQGNGPVGIWTWESDHVLIQYCISYRNKTSLNAKDGGGFDLDGGVTNSLIQYCLSYENQGAGYGLFQYGGASNWSDNVIRYCVSINDGQTTAGSGGIFIWNGSADTRQLKNCMIYNSVVYNNGAPLISYEDASLHENFIFANNIFIGQDPIKGKITGSSFSGNDWWNPTGDSRFLNFKNLRDWAEKTGQEMLKGKFEGMQTDPRFKGPMITDITDPYQLEKLYGYTLLQDSPLRNKGIELNLLPGIEPPAKDFYGNILTPWQVHTPGIYEIK